MHMIEYDASSKGPSDKNYQNFCYFKSHYINYEKSLCITLDVLSNGHRQWCHACLRNKKCGWKQVAWRRINPTACRRSQVG